MNNKNNNNNTENNKSKNNSDKNDGKKETLSGCSFNQQLIIDFDNDLRMVLFINLFYFLTRFYNRFNNKYENHNQWKCLFQSKVTNSYLNGIFSQIDNNVYKLVLLELINGIENQDIQKNKKR